MKTVLCALALLSCPASALVAQVELLEADINIGGGITSSTSFEVFDSLTAVQSAESQESASFVVLGLDDVQPPQPSHVTDWQLFDM